MSWIALRDNEFAGVFDNRKEAIKWLKKLFKQTLKDLDKQDKTDEFDYDINYPEYKIEYLEKNREAHLGL